MSAVLVRGEEWTSIPEDLYIPPDALEVILEEFAGPLDLLLYLIRRENIDVLDIPIAEVTRQYMTYVEIMKAIKLELAADYLVMAAMLAEIKSRMLLPRPVAADPEEADPRAELVRRLLEYERYQAVCESLEARPRVGRELFLPEIPMDGRNSERPAPTVTLEDLLSALRAVLRRENAFAHHRVMREPLSVRERMTHILERVRSDGFTEFSMLFQLGEGKRGVVVTFLAILELVRESLVMLVQNEPFAPIHLKAAA
ncbi:MULTISPECIES: segregation and condensation protein A [Acidiferrobacter]|jgi:segregation and condensation protein A|uniref:Segregation and condensation protein A n=1 Tax=Acidiferrobacter thiooxydans TaxID=163359 RepID=A0A1C2G3A8_9GAMM|nr:MULTISPECIES: segregation/condensation protein A [Acidiferrobacter]RCN56005.1 segregation/condensation protein A [Acidiferrobacter thiooxydans]UEN98725.1 segregation/condensation protein A [Acidiferrobacter thiooxydans]